MSMHDQRELSDELEQRLSQKRRKHPRKPYRKEVLIAENDRVRSEFGRNISAGGLFVETISPIEVAQEIKLVILLPNYERPIKIVGEVVRVTDRGIGVKFKPGSPIIEDMIEITLERM
jgi:Tfp pilus assembly protein PilZ